MIKTNSFEQPTEIQKQNRPIINAQTQKKTKFLEAATTFQKQGVPTTSVPQDVSRT